MDVPTDLHEAVYWFFGLVVAWITTSGLIELVQSRLGRDADDRLKLIITVLVVAGTAWLALLASYGLGYVEMTREEYWESVKAVAIGSQVTFLLTRKVLRLDADPPSKPITPVASVYNPVAPAPRGDDS